MCYLKLLPPHTQSFLRSKPITIIQFPYTSAIISFLYSTLCIGEGNGNPLQYSCLESPMDGGAW